jgi:hypothetical protein
MIEPLENDPRRALASTVEAVVLGFHIDPAAAQLELVCESYFKHAEANRAFSLFRFSNVTQFDRRIGLHKSSEDVESTFVARDVIATWVIQSVRTKQRDERTRIEISFGHSYGSIAFEYGHLTHELIHLYAKASGVNTWDYSEVGTNRPIDFYNPFDRPWASPSERDDRTQ